LTSIYSTVRQNYVIKCTQFKRNLNGFSSRKPTKRHINRTGYCLYNITTCDNYWALEILYNMWLICKSIFAAGQQYFNNIIILQVRYFTETTWYTKRGSLLEQNRLLSHNYIRYVGTIKNRTRGKARGTYILLYIYYIYMQIKR